MTFEEWRLALLIAADLSDILQAERGQRRFAEYLRQSIIAVFNRNMESFTWDNDLDHPTNLFAGKARTAKRSNSGL